ncbi:Zn(2)-C6 fungal-type domain-containing protein [Mycena indigotica]|uniref:Zn(2)-C6 fungal-type domain-containing protein n=1 Tax=Mycena indigotica TaxID=2126181 RepID=A0A8H6T7X0_9AGAR|nr:Zn(2)-C6 fungal-type domain-containing protein [Mycena indigotica]KAF7311977.1 Zn(2)-C6 fungal-type domain-containing protein [Mycena indigotica]
MNSPTLTSLKAPVAFDFDYPVRVSRACANCRSSKTKCVTDSQDRACMRCCFSGLDCVYEPTERQRERHARKSHPSSSSNGKARRGRKRLAVRPPTVIPASPTISQYDCDELYCKCPSDSDSYSPAASPGPRTPAIFDTTFLPSTSTAQYPAPIQPPPPPPVARYAPQWLEYPESASESSIHFSADEFTFDVYPPALPDSACLPGTFNGALAFQSHYVGDAEHRQFDETSALGLFDLDLDLNDFRFTLPLMETDQTIYSHVPYNF